MKKISPPSIKHSIYEGRIFIELPLLLALYPILHLLPKGDNHPVMVLPGFTTGDCSTYILRTILKKFNYTPYGWGIGINKGYTKDRDKKLIKNLIDIYKQHQTKVSLIGWSLGGCFARELARRYPDIIRSVITLGSPIMVDPRKMDGIGFFTKILHE